MSKRGINVQLSPGSRLAFDRLFAQLRRRSPQRRRLTSAFAVKRVVYHRNVIALGEGPGIFPLARMDRTQVIYPSPQPSAPLAVRFRSPGIDRWIRLLFAQEGAPLCN